MLIWVVIHVVCPGNYVLNWSRTVNINIIFQINTNRQDTTPWITSLTKYWLFCAGVIVLKQYYSPSSQTAYANTGWQPPRCVGRLCLFHLYIDTVYTALMRLRLLCNTADMVCSGSLLFPTGHEGTNNEARDRLLREVGFTNNKDKKVYMALNGCPIGRSNKLLR